MCMCVYVCMCVCLFTSLLFALPTSIPLQPPPFFPLPFSSFKGNVSPFQPSPNPKHTPTLYFHPSLDPGQKLCQGRSLNFFPQHSGFPILPFNSWNVWNRIFALPFPRLDLTKGMLFSSSDFIVQFPPTSLFPFVFVFLMPSILCFIFLMSCPLHPVSYTHLTLPTNAEV